MPANDVEKGQTDAFERAAVDASAARQAAIQAAGLRRLGNPGPLGLFSFASTTLILSLYNVNARHINTPNVVVGMAVGVGGLCQLLAGMWEFACGNTFGATAFSSYGGFWLSFSLIYIPGSGILTAYDPASGNASQLKDALGIYLITWFIVTFIFLLAAIRTHLAFVGLFGFLALTFMLLAIGQFMTNLMVTKAGGAFGVITAFIAYYTGASELITKETAFVSLPLMHLRRID
ncbi:GPR1/FUN34/yaaH family-domain-containing protein [Gautieria morchelliformis]|nr:GPR1/FUN34/yaaH family-domain-containing protein [Gautieria morchelliformis]